FVKGQPFVPVSFVSTYFGLNYSFVSDGPFIRVYNNSATYPDSFLGTAFKTRINEMKTSLVEENKITTPTNNTPRPPIVRNPPHDEDPLSPPVEVIIPIIDVYPAFNVSNVGRTNELLDKLAEKKIQTVFFLSTSDIISLDKLIRRIWFEGHEIGIRLGSHNILAELEEANRLLKILLKLKTRIIMLPEEIKISEDVSMLLEGQGYMIWRNNVKIIEEESVEIGHNERYLPDDEPLEGKSPDDTIGEVSIERKSYTESILEDLSATEDPKVLILDDSQETVDNISELLGSIENGHYKLRTIDSYTLPIQSVK
ncbi:MAG: hypothetical protein GX633_02115, partial [Clostridiales bacterium]|nr:hypothetical protein [Clostridiales bacterium]